VSGNARVSPLERRLDKVTAIAFIVVLIITTLAFGSIEAWSIGLASVLLIILLELWAVQMIVARKVSIAVPAEALPLIGLIVLGIIQGIAWTTAEGKRASLSWSVDSTRATVVILVLLLGAMLLAANHWASSQRLKQFAWTLTIFGFAIAVFALVQKFTWNGNIYWLRPMSGLMSAFGPFASHGLYAGFMELLFPIPIAMVLTGALRGPARLFAVFASVMIGLSIIFSLSRGGMIALAAGLLFLGVVAVQMAIQRRRSWRSRYEEDDDNLDSREFDEDEGYETSSRSFVRSWLPQLAAVGLIAVLLFGGIFWLGPDLIFSRVTEASLTETDLLQGQNFYANRGFIWRGTWEMIKANPVTGVGLGAFPTAFPRYTDTDGTYPALQAHNDLLQIFADGGIVGGVLAICFVVLLARSFARGLRARDPWRRAMALGMGTAMVSLLVHSVFDWNLQVTSTALLFLSYGAILGRIGEKVVEHEGAPDLDLVSSRGVATR
jgi:O-Antigen ligase